MTLYTKRVDDQTDHFADACVVKTDNYKAFRKILQLDGCVIKMYLAHQIGISAVFTDMRKFYLTYPIPTHGKVKNCHVKVT